MRILLTAALALLTALPAQADRSAAIPLSELMGDAYRLDFTAPRPWEPMFDFDNSGVNVPQSANFGCATAASYQRDGFVPETPAWIQVGAARTCSSIDDCLATIQAEPFNFVTERDYRPAKDRQFIILQRIFVNFEQDTAVVETLIEQPGSPQWGGCIANEHPIRSELIQRIHQLGTGDNT